MPANAVCAAAHNWRHDIAGLVVKRGGMRLALGCEPMKALGLVVVAGLVGACSESGAHLTLSAPNGPGEAAAFRVVLATPEQIPQVANQRVSPNAAEVQTVPYYLQRTIAGAEEIDRVDGLRIRLAPDLSLTETEFIPFVLLYDRAGALVGVATFRTSGATKPSPVIVVPDEIDKYTLEVEPVVQVTEEERPAPGQAHAVECETSEGVAFTSGIAWRPLGGGELRLLFPSDGGVDARERELDLDCDDHPVTEQSSGRDCDDTRVSFNRSAVEVCDGFDTNCDGLNTTVELCTAPGICGDPTTGMGLALCDDRTGQVGQCMSDPQCLCANQQAGCARCTIDYEYGAAGGSIKPCQPGIGALSTGSLCSGTEPCTVHVLAARGGWKAEVANESTMAFGSSATGVGAKVLLKAKRPEGPGYEMTKVFSLGEVDLLITTKSGQQHFKGVDLGPGDGGAACPGSGPFTMYCFP